MGKTVQNAFTLVELLVVIAIMGVIGVFALANYRSFGEDRNLKNASLDIQNLLRQAQTNATAGVKCNPLCVADCPNALWQVEFAVGGTTVNLKCQDILPSPSSTIKKILPMPTNIQISTLVGCPSPVSFNPVSGKLNLSSSCTVTLTNSKTGSIKSFKIEQGGRIYEP